MDQHQNSAEKRTAYNGKNIAGRRYGSLVALSPTEERKRKSVVWLCRCDCGETVTASVRDLNRGAKLSCGCRKHHAPRPDYAIRNNLHYQDNTCIEHLLAAVKAPAKSKCGVKGVTERKDGTYVAYIRFQRKRIFLGTFCRLEDAAKARHAAEEELQISYLKEYFRREKSLSTPAAEGAQR